MTKAVEIISERLGDGAVGDKFDYTEVQITEIGGGIAKVETINQFADAKLRSPLLENIERAGYMKNPTLIQKKVIPIIQSGRDLMICGDVDGEKLAAL